MICRCYRTFDKLAALHSCQPNVYSEGILTEIPAKKEGPLEPDHDSNFLVKLNLYGESGTKRLQDGTQMWQLRCPAQRIFTVPWIKL